MDQNENITHKKMGCHESRRRNKILNATFRNKKIREKLNLSKQKEKITFYLYYKRPVAITQ